jgi:hypothetical protein
MKQIENSNALARQKAQIEKLTEESFAFGLTVGAGFVRSMRKSGYKSTAKALDELIDNGYEAGGANIHVVFGYEGTRSEKKPEPDELAMQVTAAAPWLDRKGCHPLEGETPPEIRASTGSPAFSIMPFACGHGNIPSCTRMSNGKSCVARWGGERTIFPPRRSAH